MTPRVLERYENKTKSWAIVLGDPDEVLDQNYLNSLSRPTQWGLESRWQMATIREPLQHAIRRMLAGGELGRAGKSGRPTYLACATLAAMLGTTPEKITDFLGNHRRRPRTGERGSARECLGQVRKLTNRSV